MECEKARDLGFFPKSLAFLMGSPCAPKRKAVGSNPARDAKKRRETLDFSKWSRRYFFAHCPKTDYYNKMLEEKGMIEQAVNR